MPKKSIAATALLLILMVLAGTANGSLYKEEIRIEVTNGNGSIDRGIYTNYLPCDVTVDVTGWIVSPSNGSWRICILVNDQVFFNESGIVANKNFSQKITVAGLSKSNVKVKAWWSEKANTTLMMQAEGSKPKICPKIVKKIDKEIVKPVVGFVKRTILTLIVL